MYTPLEGFKTIALYPLSIFSLDISITNMSITMIFIFISIITLASTLLVERKLIPTLPQIFIENIYEHSISLIATNIGKRGMLFFPYILSLYVFIAISNSFGGMPFSSIITAQLIITIGLGFSTFVGLIILFYVYHGTYLLSAFLPSGSPTWIAPLLVMIELISYLFRPISLSVRLFANIMAGHTLIVILAGFGYKLLLPLSIYTVVSICIISLIAFITIIECGVQLIQAYVFTLLTCNYLSNTLYLDH
jgi:ATP synthase subunit 6